MTTILIKKKDTAGAPAPGDLTNAAGGTEIAVNTATKRIYTKDSGGNVVELGTNSTSSTIDQLTVVTSTTLSYGTANQVQYLNASKLLVGSANMTFNGTTLVVNDITDSSLTAGRVTYAGTAGNLVDSANLTFNGTTLTANTLSLTNALATTSGGTGLTSFTANGVVYASSSSALATGSALTFDGTNLSVTSPSTATTFTLSDNGARLVVLKNALGAGGGAEVGTTTNHDFYVRAGASAAGLNSLYLQAGGVTGYSLSYAGLHTWFVGATRTMDLTSIGLGIGTSSPSAKLELFSNADANFGIKIYHTSVALANQRYPQIELAHTPIAQGYQNKVFLRYQNSVTYGNYPSFAVITDAAGAGENTRMFLDGFSGYLGINTTQPSEMLQINSGNIRLQGSSPGQILFFSTGNGVSQNATLEVQNDGATTNTGEFRFSTRNQAGTLAERVRLGAEGKLCINRTSTINGAWLAIQAENNQTAIGTIWADNTYLIQQRFDSSYFMGVGADAAGRNLSLAANSADATAKITFLTSGNGTLAERARIKSAGEIASASAGDYGIRTAVTAGAGTTTGIFVGARSATAGDTGSGTDTFIVWSNGNVVNTNNSYGSISDIKLKENIIDATPKLEKLSQVRVVNFNMIGETQKQLGVIAQELEQIFPGMVDESPDKDAEGNDLGTTTKSVKYSVFVPMLIKALQEQQAIIESLKARLDAANL